VPAHQGCTGGGGVVRVAKATPIPSKKNIRKNNLAYSLYNIHSALRASMEEKRLECLMMLQIHRSDTPGIDEVIDRFATSAAGRLNFLI